MDKPRNYVLSHNQRGGTLKALEKHKSQEVTPFVGTVEATEEKQSLLTTG